MKTQAELILISPVLNGAGKFDHWNMNYNNKDYIPKDFPAIPVLDKNNADFTVTIQNAPKVTFSADPIYFGPAGSTKPTGHDGKEIHTIKGENSATLTFKDNNWKKGDIAYVFNFNGAPQLDPVIGNNGGGPPAPNYSWYAVGAIALLVVALLAFRAMRKKAN